MSELTDERLRQILADCEGVTPGPWEPTQDWPDSDARVIRAGSMAVAQSWVADAKHLANFDPDTVRALVEELQAWRQIGGPETVTEHLACAELEAERDALRAEVERLKREVKRLVNRCLCRGEYETCSVCLND